MHAAYSALGRFTVRFRWLVLLVVWLVAIIGSFAVFPSLTSVTKANNSDFLPKNSPSTIASDLASPLQNVQPHAGPGRRVPHDGKLTATDARYIEQLITALEQGASTSSRCVTLARRRTAWPTRSRPCPTSTLGQDGPSKTLIGDLRAAVRSVRAPPGIQTNVAGQARRPDRSRGEVRQHRAAGPAAVDRVHPDPADLHLPVAARAADHAAAGVADQSVRRSGRRRAHPRWLQVSSLSQIMLIILVLGAGTDYALFLIFRVREEIRSGLRATGRDRAVGRAGRRVDHLLRRHGHRGPAQPAGRRPSASTRASARRWRSRSS